MICSRCRAEHDRRGQRYCLSCHAAATRAWRARNPMTAEQRMKDRARSYAGAYLRRGVIKKGPCVSCGSAESQMHHPDYAKPIEVIWMCRPCHLAAHTRRDPGGS